MDVSDPWLGLTIEEADVRATIVVGRANYCSAPCYVEAPPGRSRATYCVVVLRQVLPSGSKCGYGATAWQLSEHTRQIDRVAVLVPGGRCDEATKSAL